MTRFNGGRGSLTVEAAVVLPVFICIIISIAFFIKVVYVHEVIQHAIMETAGEVSTYSYIYSISGLQDIHDQTVDKLESHKRKIQDQVKTVVDTADSFKELNNDAQDCVDSTIDGINSGSPAQAIDEFNELSESAENLKKKYEDTKGVFEQIAKDPKGEMRSLVCAFAKSGLEDTKAELILKPVVKVCMVKYLGCKDLNQADKTLKRLNIVGGIEGLDFSESKLFEDKKHIDVIVRYRVRLNLPVNVLPELNLVQRARVRAWLDGEDAPKETPVKENIWELGYFERGKRIQEIYGRNLPDNFKTITKFEPDNGTATLVTSIDINSGSYQKDPRSVGYKINAVIRKFADFEKDTKTRDEQGKTIQYYVNKDQIKQRKLIVVVPKGSSTEKFNEVFSKCRQGAEDSEIELVIEEL